MLLFPPPLPWCPAVPEIPHGAHGQRLFFFEEHPDTDVTQEKGQAVGSGRAHRLPGMVCDAGVPSIDKGRLLAQAEIIYSLAITRLLRCNLTLMFLGALDLNSERQSSAVQVRY